MSSSFRRSWLESRRTIVNPEARCPVGSFRGAGACRRSVWRCSR
jgi:hypothetical protein